MTVIVTLCGKEIILKYVETMVVVEPQRCPFPPPNFTSFPLSLINYRLKWSIGLIKVTLGMYTMNVLLYFHGFVVVVIFY